MRGFHLQAPEKMEDFVSPKTTAAIAVEETLDRISKQKGVKAVIVLNEDDLPIRSNTDSALTMAYANSSRPIESIARHIVRDMDPSNELVLIRIRTLKNEIIIAPENQHLLVVIQNKSVPTEE